VADFGILAPPTPVSPRLSRSLPIDHEDAPMPASGHHGRRCRGEQHARATCA